MLPEAFQLKKINNVPFNSLAQHFGESTCRLLFGRSSERRIKCWWTARCRKFVFKGDGKGEHHCKGKGLSSETQSGFFPHIFIPCVAVSSMMLGGVSEPGCVFWLGLQKCILICFFQRLSLFHFFHSWNGKQTLCASAAFRLAGTDSLDFKVLQTQITEHKALCQAAEVERDRLLELVTVLQKR